jgi:hypothetical protein
MARCPRNRNSKILEREVMQILPSAPEKIPAKFPQQPRPDQNDQEHDRPSNLSAHVGQLLGLIHDCLCCSLFLRRFALPSTELI